MSCSVDSLNVCIPLAKVNILLDNLSRITDAAVSGKDLCTQVYSEDDLLDYSWSEARKFAVHTHAEYVNGVGGNTLYETSYQLCTIKTKRKVTALDKSPFDYINCFSITIHSKLLKQRYFDGLTPDTLRLAYDEITRQGVLEFSFDDFLHSTFVSDVDIKTDHYCDDLDAYSRLCYSSLFQGITLPTKLFSGCSGSTGFTVGRRSGQTDDYFKLYDKAAFFSKPEEISFYNKFLSHLADFPNARVECSFRTVAKLRDYGLLPTGTKRTLFNIVSNVATHGLAAMAKMQRLYMVSPMFIDSRPVSSEYISTSKTPPATVLKKVDAMLLICANARISRSVACALVLTVNRANNHRYLRGYVDWYFDNKVFKYDDSL